MITFSKTRMLSMVLATAVLCLFSRISTAAEDDQTDESKSESENSTEKKRTNEEKQNPESDSPDEGDDTGRDGTFSAPVKDEESPPATTDAEESPTTSQSDSSMSEEATSEDEKNGETLSENPKTRSPVAHSDTTMLLEPEAVPEPQKEKNKKRTLSPKMTAVWSLAGGCGLALITGGIFGMAALEEKARYEQNYHSDFADRMRARAIASDVFFGLGAAAAVSALIVLFVVKENTRESESKIRVSLGPSEGSVVLRF